MSPEDYAALRLSVQAHEGRSLSMYTDSTGHWTIGYGRNIQDDGISEAEAEILLDNDLEKSIAACARLWPWFASLDGPRQRVFAELCFQLGVRGLSEFVQTLAAAERGDYEAAAADLLASKLAKQAPERTANLAYILRHGTAPPTVTA